MARSNKAVINHFASVIDAELAALAPKPKRKYTPMSAETRAKMEENRWTGYYTPRATGKPAGRPKGSSNKPKPVDATTVTRVREPRKDTYLDHTNVSKYFGLDGAGRIRRVVKGALGMPAVRTQHGGRLKFRAGREGEPLVVLHSGMWYPAALVAWWLVFECEPDDDCVPVNVQDLSNDPRYVIKDLLTGEKICLLELRKAG